jgi:hypothetical protein
MDTRSLACRLILNRAPGKVPILHWMVLHVCCMVYETHAGDTVRFLNIMCAIINALAASDACRQGIPLL